MKQCSEKNYRSWLFTTALVLAVGVMGRNGLAYDEDCRTAISCLEQFSPHDPHARRYAQIARTLYDTTRAHVDRHMEQLRLERKRSTARAFGFHAPGELDISSSLPNEHPEQYAIQTGQGHRSDPPAYDGTDIITGSDNGDLFALPWLNDDDPILQDFLQPERSDAAGALSDIPLFPLDQHPMLP